MAKNNSIFICQQCGYQSPSFLGKCPNCGSWNSLVETVTGVASKSSRSHAVPKTVKLADIKPSALKRTSTGLGDMDSVLGGGVVPGMVTLVTGEPGIGKSTLLLSLAQNWPGPVIYVAGEESASQIKIRADRMKLRTTNIQILEETDVDAVISLLSDLSNLNHLMVIVDSIQTLITADLAGTAGSVGQVRETAGRLISAVKPQNVPLFLVGHVTKEGAIAGPKVLEHAVDTILTIEGEKYGQIRLIRTQKNRFGPTDEVCVLQMTDTGLTPVANIQGLFADLKDQTNPGTCLTIAMEGSRPLLVEIQALTTNTPLPSPRRVASGVDYNRLQTIIAVLQKRLNIPLYKEDIYVSVAGGLTLSEPAVDLPIALAIISSFRNKPLSAKTIAFGELDLIGNIRQVQNADKRIKEAKKLGFSHVLSKDSFPNLSTSLF